MVFRRNAAVVAAIIAQVWADASNGFDNPPANGEAGDYSDDPVYYVGNQVEIKWHMNFTDALLKLVQTPSDHESTSSYIIASPTNKTSYEWTVSYLDLDETYTAFYLSVYRAGASDASFISHYVNILPARSTSSTYSSASSSQGSPTTFLTSEQSSTAITSSRGTTSVSAASTPSSVAPTENPQAMSGANTVGISIGSTMGTLLSQSFLRGIMFAHHHLTAFLCLIGIAAAIPKGGGAGGGRGGGYSSSGRSGTGSSGSSGIFGKTGGWGASYGGGDGGGSRSRAPLYAGAGFLLGAGAGAYTGLGIGSHDSNTTIITNDPLDCEVAKRLDLKPKVDCQYTWEHWFGDNHLYYVIRIDASGQNSIGWFQGIYDNIQGECGAAPHCDKGSDRHCFDNMLWKPRDINGSTIYGLEAAYKINDWVVGDDQTTCITTAIQKASCGIELDFVNGKCYKKKGSFQVPYHIEE
ncbi:hypothetical protein SCAR479_07477 [Seiridium cardinale]|uniref:Uncharacterized protein n=1 Tax=Seiridium cardinale TaxID=138064 RepID=A0ABR2XQB8_9PEZI